jgi:hypothetical protein
LAPSASAEDFRHERIGMKKTAANDACGLLISSRIDLAGFGPRHRSDIEARFRRSKSGVPNQAFQDGHIVLDREATGLPRMSGRTGL